MKVVFLGTNGWYDTDTGNTVSMVIDAPDAVIILDAGYGLAKLDRYVSLDRPAFLFLSHLHLDHIVGLHVVTSFDFAQGLSICGPDGFAPILNRVLDVPFTVPARDFNFEVTFMDLSREAGSLPFKVKALPLVHSVPTSGYRFEIHGKTVTYVGDTGYCENAVELARNTDLLITECAYRSGQENPAWPHLNPETAALIAKEGDAGQLALVHFDARMYPTLAHRRAAEASARKVFPRTTAAMDGMVLEI